MSVSFDAFLEWANDKFGPENIKVRSNGEICTHSFFAHQAGIEDWKYHLWMRPDGGKKQLKHGAYRCWKTDAMGSLVGLVMKMDHITFDEAEAMLCGESSLRALERKCHEFFGSKDAYGDVPEPVKPEPAVDFPEHTLFIKDMSKTGFKRLDAERYLRERKLPVEKFAICLGDKEFENRIIIPYYDRTGKLIYYNARTMSKNNKIIRYRKCDGVDQDTVVYFPEWPKPGERIYLMEGEFDAESVFVAKLFGCACGGKHLSDTQIEMLRDYQITLAFDSDKAGLEAMTKIGGQLLEKGFSDLKYVRPPKVYKDWNKLLQQRNAPTVRAYIERFEKSYNAITADLLKLKEL